MEYSKKYYLQNKATMLEYQKQYNKSNKEWYRVYQISYYHDRSANDPEFVKQKKLARQRTAEKKKAITREKKQIKKTKLLKAQLLKELLITYDFEEPVDEPVDEPIVEPLIIEEPKPFADFKINSRGLFYLEW